MFINDLKLIIRKLRKERFNAIINVLGLTVGLTAFLLISLYVQDERSFDQFQKNKKNIYRVVGKGERIGAIGMIASDFVEYFSDIPEIDSFTRITKMSYQTLLKSEVKQLYAKEVLYVESNFFDFFTFPLKDASRQGAFSESGQAVISETLAKQFFGEENPIGKQIQVEKGDLFIVTSVVRDPPKTSTIQFDLLLYKKDFFKNDPKNPGRVSTAVTYISGFPKHDLKAIESKIREARNRPHYSNFLLNVEYSLLPITSQRLLAQYDEDIFEKNDIKHVRLFSGIAIVVLLLALINYVNSVTAQSLKRMKEVGLKKVIGATRKHLIVSQLMESFFFTLASFFLAFAIAERLMPMYNSLLGKGIVLNYFNRDFFVWTILASLVIGLLSGLYPAYYITKIAPLALLDK